MHLRAENAHRGYRPIARDERIEAAPDAERAMMASGEIVNTSTVEVTPRRLHFIFKDKAGNTVGEKSYDLEPDRIAPLGRRPFRQRLDDPPADAADVKVTIEPVS